MPDLIKTPNFRSNKLNQGKHKVNHNLAYHDQIGKDVDKILKTWREK